MVTVTKKIGPISAYAIAKEEGYTGTKEQFAQEIANASTNAQAAAASASAAADSAASAAASASQAMSGTPEGYSNLVASVAPAYNSTIEYAVGDMVLKDSTLYQCITPIPAGGEEWTPSHWTAVTVGDTFSRISDTLDEITTATASDVGKLLKTKNIVQGKVTEWEFATPSDFTTPAKNALLECLRHVAWADENGKDYYDALETMLISGVELVSITAVYTGVNVVVGTPLNNLKSDLTVTAYYSDGGSGRVLIYNLYGTIAAGTNTITVAYGGKTDTFTVIGTEYPAGYTPLLCLTSSGTQYIDTGINYASNMAMELTGKGFCAVLTDQTYLGNVTSGSGGYAFALNSTTAAWTESEGKTVYFRYGLAGTEYSFMPDPTAEYTLKLQQNQCYINGTLEHTYTAITESCADSMILFARRGGGSTINQYAQFSVKQLKFWDSSGNLIADMSPFLDANGVPCMYDKVRGRTFYNLGTGTFTYEEVQ